MDQKKGGASTTPLLPLELAPFTLNPLLPLIFSSSSTSTAPPTSATPTSPPSLFSSFTQSTLPAHPSSSSTNTTTGELPHVKAVEANGTTIWIASSDARVRRYQVADSPPSVGTGDERPRTPLGAGGGRRTPTSPFSSASSTNSSYYKDLVPMTAVELVEDTTPTATGTKRSVDRIALMEKLGKAVILSEGILTFHSLPSLSPLSVHAFPSLRGVTTIALDESELSSSTNPSSTSSQPLEMHLIAIKRRTVHLLRVTKDGCYPEKELALRGGAFLSVFRKGYVCIADQEQYSVVDLKAAVAIPLVPISQAPNPPSPPPTSSTSQNPSSTTPPPSSSGGGPDPRQRPAIACVGTNEFLIASHTGPTTLGVFVTEQGEPCRGTLEWGSNLRSLVVDSPYVLALLFNHTIEIHSLHTQEIVQVLQLPRAPSPSSPPSSLHSSFAFQPRSLLRVWGEGLSLGPAGGGIDKIDLVEIVVGGLRQPRIVGGEVPRTPTRTTASRLRNESEDRSPMSTPTSTSTSTSSHIRSGSGGGGGGGGKKKLRSRILVVGKNGLHAIAPLTLVVQADAMIEKGRVEEAVRLADQVVSSSSNGNGSMVDQESSYVYLRCAYSLLSQTLFQDALNLFLKARSNPLLVVRMFPELVEGLMGNTGEVVMVPKGVEAVAREGLGVDEYIMANLNHNYSPHLKPDVENAAEGKELRLMLGTTARDCLRGYLGKWREGRRSAGAGGVGTGGDSRKVDIVVDTTLARLFVEEKLVQPLAILLDGPNDVVLQLLEPALIQAGLFEILASEWLRKGEVGKTLEVWTRIVDGTYKDDGFVDGVEKVEALLWKSKEKEMVEKWGIWLLVKDRLRGLKLFTDPKQTITFNTRELFNKIRTVDPDAADLYLESVVLQKRDNDAGLHADLIKRYIAKLGEFLGDSETKSHLREQELAYNSSSSSSPAQTFLSFLTTSYDPSSSHAEFDRVRLKTILFLARSGNYDVAGTKKDLDEMEVKGLRGLTLERVVVYGKLKLDRQALSLLLHTLRDLSSAETYCHQSGDPLLSTDVTSAAAKLSLVLPKAKSAKSKGGSGGGRPELARLLVEMCLVGVEGAGGEGEIGEEKVAGILETQGVHLEAIEVIPLLPATWSILPLTPFLSRSLRRSLHDRHEAGLLKALASSQNFTVSDRLAALQVRMGPTVQKKEDGGSPGEKSMGEVVKEIKEVKEKLSGSGEAVELDLR